ncbi:MAG: hypothetical protein RIF32_22520 [Leptospirales bacterium]|jgi:hypothetical protein
MDSQKVRVLVEGLSGGRVRLRFLSRDDARSGNPASPTRGSGSPRDPRDDHEFFTGGVVESGLLDQEALLASISLGHMRAYMDLCFRNDLRIDIYRDDAIATTAREIDAEHVTTRVLLRPRLAFRDGDSPEVRATAIRLLNEALGQSVFFDAPRITIELEPVFEFRNTDAVE